MKMISFKDFLILKERLLIEAVDYNQMFTKIVDRHSDPEWASSMAKDRYIPAAQNDLKKNFRIVWFLKFVQWFVAYNSEQKEGMEPLYNKILNDISKGTGKTPQEVEKLLVQTNVPRSILPLYKHALDLNIPEINDYNPTGKLPSEVFEYFSKIENEWASELEGKIPYNDQPIIKDDEDEGVYPIIDFGDGWYWVDLEKSSCDLESKAMGHCGNAGNSGSTLLSLRKLIKKSNNPSTWVWEPHLTFELEEDGMLGQMKGKQNDKPDIKYHDKIITLLTHKVQTSTKGNEGFYIRGIRGGGYKPETNFSLEDLTPEQSQFVIETNPNLDILVLLKKEFGDRVVEIKGATIRIDGFPRYSKTSTVIGLDDLYIEKRNGVSSEFVTQICSDGFIGDPYDFDYSSIDEILNYYSISNENSSKIEKFLDDNYSDWREDYDNWEDYVKDTEPTEIDEVLKRADLYSKESSIQDEIFNSFKSAVNEFEYLIYDGGETFSYIFNKKRDHGLMLNLVETGTPNEDGTYSDPEVFWTWYEPNYGWSSGNTTNKTFNEYLTDVIAEEL